MHGQQNIKIKSCVWVHFPHTCEPTNTTGMSHLYSINWLVCISETVCVYCAVRTGFLCWNMP